MNFVFPSLLLGTKGDGGRQTSVKEESQHIIRRIIALSCSTGHFQKKCVKCERRRSKAPSFLNELKQDSYRLTCFYVVVSSRRLPLPCTCTRGLLVTASAGLQSSSPKSERGERNPTCRVGGKNESNVSHVLIFSVASSLYICDSRPSRIKTGPPPPSLTHPIEAKVCVGGAGSVGNQGTGFVSLPT